MGKYLMRVDIKVVLFFHGGVGFFNGWYKGVGMMTSNKFENIETDNLILRKFKKEDLEDFYHYRNEPEIRRYKGEGWCDCTLEKAKEFIDQQKNAEPGKPKHWFQVAIELKSNNELIGDLGMYTLEEEKTAQMIIAIAPEYLQEEFGLEATKALLNYIFNELDIIQVDFIADERNRAAMNLMEYLRLEKQGGFTTNEEADGEDKTEHFFTVTKEQWG